MGLLKLAGFQAVRITSFWEPGLSEPTPHEAMVLANVDAAATMHGVRVYLSVYNAGSRTTPLTVVQRKEFAAYAAAIAKANPGFRDVIVGNEPNLNRFWMPQFALNGTGASAPAYLRLLATTLRRAQGGGARGPRLGRRARAPRRRQAEHGPRHDLPHPLPPRARRRVPDERPRAPGHGRLLVPSLPAQLERPRRRAALGSGPSRADRPGRARETARQGVRRHRAGRHGDADPLRRVRDRVGDPGRQARALRRRRARDDAAGAEATQAAAYRRAIQLAYCQSNVAGMLLFHTHDEPGRPGWQSGLVYADGSPKTSLEPVRRAIESAGTNALGACPVEAKVSAAFTTAERTISLRCERACTYRARLLRLPRRTAVATATGRAAAGRRLRVRSDRPRARPAGTSSRVSFLDASLPDAPSSASARRMWCVSPRRRAPCRVRWRRRFWLPRFWLEQ